jgi:predicted AlkP superfamily phosphohydrolase/phosphomutase
LDGFVVGGFGAPNSAADITYPIEILKWIEQELGPYKPVIEPKFLRWASPEKIFTAERNHQSSHIDIGSQLAARFQTDILVINLMLTDHANHKMPRMDQVHEAYRQSDIDLGILLDKFRPDNVMLISDHGSSRLKGDFLLNAWLRDQGFLVFEQNSLTERSRALNWILMQWLQKHLRWSGLPERMLRRLVRWILVHPINGISDWFWKKIESTIPFARDYVSFSDRPDYKRTKVFPGSIYSGLLYLNLVGREPGGVVPLDDRWSLAGEIATKLSQIQEPDTGHPLFSNIHFSADLYDGPAKDYAPDLILDSYDTGWNIRSSKYVPIPEQTFDRYFIDVVNRRDFGWHSRDGIFVFSGKDFCVGPTSIDAHVMDVPATLLHLYGVPIPADYDGRVLTELMVPDLRLARIDSQPGDDPKAFAIHDSFTVEEYNEMADHLRALGYLD